MAANMMPNASVIGTDNTSPMTECPSIHASRQRKQMPSDHKNAVLRDLIFTRRFLSSSSLILSSRDRPADKLRIRIPIPKNHDQASLDIEAFPDACNQHRNAKQAKKQSKEKIILVINLHTGYPPFLYSLSDSISPQR